MNGITKVSRTFPIHSIITLTLKTRTFMQKHSKPLLKNRRHVLPLLGNEVNK